MACHPYFRGLLPIEGWLPNLGLVAAFNLHQSRRPALAPRVSAKSLCLRALEGTPSLLLLLYPSLYVHLLLLLLSALGELSEAVGGVGGSSTEKVEDL